jgi:hypothetical protein
MSSGTSSSDDSEQSSESSASSDPCDEYVGIDEVMDPESEETDGDIDKFEENNDDEDEDDDEEDNDECDEEALETSGEEESESSSSGAASSAVSSGGSRSTGGGNSGGAGGTTGGNKKPAGPQTHGQFTQSLNPCHGMNKCADPYRLPISCDDGSLAEFPENGVCDCPNGYIGVKCPE